MFLDDTIGNWTVAELQNFLQSVAQLEPTQLPPAISPAQADIAQATVDSLKINSIIDLSSDLKMSRDGQTMKKGQTLVSDFWGRQYNSYPVEPSQAFHFMLGDNVRCQSVDPGIFSTAATDSITLGDGTLDLTAVYMPVPDNVNTFNWYNATAATGATYNNFNGFGLYQANLDITSFTGTLDLIAQTANDGTIWNSTGEKFANFTSGIDIDAGLYYIANLTNWSAITTQPQLLGHNAPALNAGMNASGGFARKLRVTGAQTALPSSINVVTDVTANTQIAWLAMT